MTEVFLTDAIITGCSSTELRRRILQQDRPLSEIEALGITLEGIEHQVKDFSHKASDQSTDNRILKISSKPLGKPDDRSAYMPPKSFTKKPYKSQNTDFSCYNCGRRDHIASAEVSPAKGKICHLCKRVGHFQSRCRFRKLQDKSTIHSKKKRLVEEEKNDTQILEDNGKTYYAFHTGNDSNIVKCEIGGVALDVLVDSGSDVNLVTDAAWQFLKQKNVKIHQSAKGSSRILRGYASNIPLTILGTFITDVPISGKSIRAEFYVIKGGQRCLLGDQTSKSLGILKVGLDIHLIGTDTKPFSKIKDVQVHIQMDSGVKPIFQPLRRVPMPLEDAVNKKLDLMLSRDIIERKEGPATWVSPLVINDVKMVFEVDSGSPITLIGFADFKKKLYHLQLSKTKIELASYCGSKIKVHGYVNVNVKYREHTCILRLFVVDTNRHPLLGREWMRKLHFDWNEIIRNSDSTVNAIALRTPVSVEVNDLIRRFPKVFETSVGLIRGIHASLNLKPNNKPIFLKARSIPFAIRDTVEREIENMVKNGILVKVEHSAWATPVMPVMKSNDRVRLCGDYKVTINKYLNIDEHPLPTIDELFANMAGGKKFTKIDLAQAYLQMAVRDQDREILTLNTHLGLYQPTRLMYGVASAPAIFQREISQILSNIPGVSVFLDDIKITGPDDETHLKRLELVLLRLNNYNIRVNVSKCEFFADRIEYCGFVINSDGIGKMKKKVDAIQEMPRPRNRDEVRAFVGLVNYYGRFLVDLSTNIYPINNLLKNSVPFEWNKACEEAFRWVKKDIQSDKILVHYDPRLPLILATDASPYGVGAVLSHQYSDGSEKPIQYASKTLNKTQQNYSQIDKEAYAIVFGIQKFYQYLYGHRFILITDNKPLSRILSPEKGLPVLSALRMQHYAVFLASFDYEIRFRTSKESANADCMSRLPINDNGNKSWIEEVDLIELNQIETLPVTVEDLAKNTRLDANVRTLLEGLRSGRSVEPHNRFGIEQNQFSIQKGCIMKGIRVYIPPLLRRRVLDELHIGHFGVSRMKSLARSYCWWESIDKDIEDLSRDCVECASVRKNPPRISSHCWERPSEPFERIHVDYAGPFLGLNFLVIVDAHTKWPEVKIIPDMTADTTIVYLREFFATFGVPSVIVSDRGVQFTSEQFQTFLKKNGITQKIGAPYHPATNGQAERFVQTFKDKLKAIKCEKRDVQFELHKILMAYRRTVHPTTGKSPSMLVFGRQIKSRLDLMVPTNGVEKIPRGEEIELRHFAVNDRVAARDYMGSSKWRYGVITERLGELHYMVELDDGRLWKRHIDQLRSGPAKELQFVSDPTMIKIDDHEIMDKVAVSSSGLLEWSTNEVQTAHQTPSCSTTLEASRETQSAEPEEGALVGNQEKQNVVTSDIATPKRSTRIRKPPKRLNL
ncbi:uncharacterized protein K02A2.6-like [Sabethes cyaneus]|uniref:uncharacterized protein K02A2.6-like n=1 Tax=Sabethes cyaneus TaxID=53552 RepID=UPI00237EC857|nr:uncharacterized protein K02A2.6-like [Sabethes cyaneus]